MSRHPAIVNAIPIPPGNVVHVPGAACPCAPDQGTDLLEPSRIVLMHHAERRRPEPPVRLSPPTFWRPEP